MSAPASAEPDFNPYMPWIRRVLDTLLAEPDLCLVNVNLPRAPRGIMWTRASVRRYDGKIVPTQDPQGRELFWFAVRPIEGAEEGTDRWALERGWVSLTPLRLDLTDERQLDAMRRRNPLDEPIARGVAPPPSPEAERSVREDESSEALTKEIDEPVATRPPDNRAS